MVLMSPEELSNPEFFRLLDDTVFYQRIFSMGLDEVHLLYWWGKAFRPCFRQLGRVRARLPVRQGKSVPIVALTATLRVGEPMDCVHKVLGLVPGQYHFIRRSNVRNDIQIILREMKSILCLKDVIQELRQGPIDLNQGSEHYLQLLHYSSSWSILSLLA